MNIANRISEIRKTIPQHVKLICVSKFHSIGEIMEAYNCGERCFGENRPQELCTKVPQLPEDIEWHFIGNLQTNKVKQVVPVSSLIQSVSNERLIEEIEAVATKLNKQCRILLEVHVAQEESKQGFSPEELLKLITPEYISHFPHIIFCGVMGMATFTDNKQLVRDEFKRIVSTFHTLKSNVFAEKDDFKEISMGMSDDYTIAIEEGATIVRIGSTIFGPRQY